MTRYQLISQENLHKYCQQCIGHESSGAWRELLNIHFHFHYAYAFHPYTFSSSVSSSSMAILFVHLLPFMVRLIKEVFSVALDYLNHSLFICSEPCSHFKFILLCNLKESLNFDLGLFISIFPLCH